MKSHLVLGLVVDAFDDVDFAVVGPVRTEHPEGRPGTADTAWHVEDVDDDETVVELLFG